MDTLHADLSFQGPAAAVPPDRCDDLGDCPRLVAHDHLDVLDGDVHPLDDGPRPKAADLPCHAGDGSKSADGAWRDRQGEAVAPFHGLVATFSEPYDEVLAEVWAGRLDAIEPATEFLVEDPWRF